MILNDCFALKDVVSYDLCPLLFFRIFIGNSAELKNLAELKPKFLLSFCRFSPYFPPNPLIFPYFFKLVFWAV